MRKLIFFIAVFFIFPGIASPESKIIAVVNKSVITQRDLDNRTKLALLSSGLKDNDANRKDLREQILHVMIDELLQLQAIKEAEISVTEEDIEDAISRMEQASGSPAGSAKQTLKVNHIPLSTLEDQARAHLGWADMLHGKYISMIQITDEDVRHELDKLQEMQQQTQYHLAEIVLPIDDQISESKARKDIAKLRSDITKGANFFAVAQQFSHSATAARGGDLGWQTENQIAPEFLEAIQVLKPGQISQPIRFSRGYALVYYVDRQRPGEPIDTEVSILQAQIPYPFLPTDYEIQETGEKLANMGRKAKNCHAFRQSLQNIEGHNVMESGTMSLGHINEEIRVLIKNLKPGQLSKIIPTQEGAIAFMLCNKQIIKPEEWTEEKVRHMLVQNKLKLMSRRDLRDLKKKAFIEIR